MQLQNADKLKTVNELDDFNNRIDDDKIRKFLSEFDDTFMDRSRPKGPDYLIIDNFINFFQLEKADLINARKEFEEMTVECCNQSKELINFTRCENLIWLKNPSTVKY